MGQTKKLTLLVLFVISLTLYQSASAQATQGDSLTPAVPNVATSTPDASVIPARIDVVDDQTPISLEFPEFFYILPRENLTPYQKMSYELEFAFGRPGNQSLSGWSSHWALSTHYYLKSSFDFSVFFRKASATGIDSVLFDTTYSEERTYAIGVMMIGIGARVRVAGNQSIEIRSGFSKTSSTLSAITSSAPTGPVLAVGYSKSIPNGIPLDLQYAYEWRKTKTGGALTVSFTQSAFGKNESTAEIALGVSLRFYSTPWEKFQEIQPAK